MSATIAGVLPIVHTPFTENDAIDVPSLQKQLHWALDRSIGGYCTGMVSELLRLSDDERNELHREIAEVDRGNRVFVAGVGAESIKQSCQFAEYAESIGCDAVMAIPPVTTKTSEQDLLSYFRTIASSISIPVIIQDASSYVGQEIPMTVNRELLETFGRDKILFKPEASPIGPKLSELRDVTNGEAKIFEGSGGISLMDSYQRGISGTMPGMEFLDGVLAVWNALEAGDIQRAYDVYFPLCALVALQLQAGLDGFLAVEKYVLKERGLFATDYRRKPYWFELDDETIAELDRLLAKLDEALLD